MSSKEILENFLKEENKELTIEDVITITFNQYKNKKNNSSNIISISLLYCGLSK